MEKEIAKKVSRFLELSNKFSKSAIDVFGKEEEYVYGNNTITFQGHVGVNIDYVLDKEDKKEPTRSERIKEKAKEEIKKANDYDEYLVLKNQLTKYFSALNDLIK